MQKSKLSIGSFNFSWHVYAIVLGLLYYLPYYFKNLLTGDTAFYKLPPSLIDRLDYVLPYIKKYTLSQAKPLYGVIEIVFYDNLPELQILLGVGCFIFATIKFVELIFSNLGSKAKLLIFSLLFCNPFIYLERYWYFQFLFQGLISILYYYSFYFIEKYKDSKLNTKKILFAYALPIGSLLIGLNFFMPSYFHFIIIAMVFILKKHLDKPFSTIRELLFYSKDFLIIIVLSSLIYIVEITILWSIANYNLEKNKLSQPWRASKLTLKERVFNLNNLYPMFYNTVGVFFSAILLIRKNTINIILFFSLCLVYSSSYFFYIVLNMYSSRILNFPNYYLSFLIMGFIFNNYKNNVIVTKSLMVVTSILVLFFYFSSFYHYYLGYNIEKQAVALFRGINKDVSMLTSSSNSKIRLLKGNKDVFFSTFFSDASGIFKQLYVMLNHLNRFDGKRYNIRDSSNEFIWHYGATLPKEVDQIRREKILKKQVYPSKHSIFYYNGIYYVVCS